MKHFVFIYFFISLLLFISCKKEKSDLEPSLFSPLSEYETPAEIKSIIDSYKFTILDTSSENALIGGGIKKIRKHNNCYFLACDYKRLLAFDDKGIFLFEINKIGGGPQEYSILADYDVYDDFIAISDINKIIFYNIKDGSYNKTININKNIKLSNLKVINENLFLLCASDLTIYLIDKTGKIIKEKRRGNELSLLHKHMPFIQYGPEKTIFQIGRSNNIISIDPKKIIFSELFFLNSKKIMSSKNENNYIKNHGHSYIRKDISSDIITNLTSHESQLLFACLEYSETPIYIADSKQNKIMYKISKDCFNNLSYTKDFIWNSVVCYSNNTFMTYINPNIFREEMDSNKKHENDTHYKWLKDNIYNKVDDESNPILVEFTFKNR